MPPRKTELPEGTDHIVKGAAQTGASSSGNGGGAVAGSTRDDTGGTVRGAAADRTSVKEQFSEQIASLRGQAGGKIREYCDEGKVRAGSALDEFSQVIDEAANAIDDRVGAEYGEYAHRAADYVASFADTVRNKDVDELIEDTRSVVRKSPGIAIAAAAVIGFALVRIIKTGLEDVGAKNDTGSGRTGADAKPGA